MRSSLPPREPKVSGAVILDQIHAIADQHGDAVLKSARATLPLEMQDELASMLAISWIDAKTAMDLKNAIARELGMDPIELQRWVVKTAVQRTIHRVWRSLLSRVDDHVLVKRAPLLYSKTFDRGALSVVTFADKSAELLVTGWNAMPDYDCIGLACGMEAVLETFGRKGAHAKFAHKPNGVTFEISWRA